MKLHRCLLRVLPLLAFVPAAHSAPQASTGILDAKQIAAPAEDLDSGRVRLPQPANTGQRSGAALLPVRLVDGRASLEVPVENGAPLAFAFVPPAGADWRVTVRRPNAAEIPLERLATEPGVRRTIGDAAPVVPGRFAERFDVESPTPGTWTFEVTTRTPSRADTGVGLLLVRSAGPYQLYSHVTGFDWIEGRSIRFRAWSFDERQSSSGLPWPRRAATVERMTLFLDDEPIPMSYDAGDHYTADFTATPGRHFIRIVMLAQTVEGGPFVRTTQHTLFVHPETVRLLGTAAQEVEADGRLRFDLAAEILPDVTKLQVSAEVWGRTTDGELQPACWLSGMVASEPGSDGTTALPLRLDPRWLEHAGLGGSLELRAIRVQDPNTHVPLARLDRIALAPSPIPLPEPAPFERPSPPVLPVMLTGTAGAQLVPGPPVAATPQLAPRPYAPRALMLVHGYCSSGMPWPTSDFSGPIEVFVDANQNRTHDEFAGLIAQFGAQLGSFGIVGHSQGGPASVHLYTYYWSGLDLAVGPRRIQSLGSPYQGTPLASLGGFSCGVNTDMTPEGAALWLAGIPTWARDDVWYWTTSYSGSWCDFFSDFLLADPEDGVVERFRAHLPGATDMGNKVGWCHTTGMSDPAGYTDSSRNTELDASAAR